MKDKKKWMMAAVVATGALIGRICYECRHFTTEYYDVASDKIPEAFEGFRFVVLSDLHNYDFDQGNRQLLGAIERLKPDAVMIAGDMIDAHPGADMSAAVRMVRDLCDRWPVYFGNGIMNSGLPCIRRHTVTCMRVGAKRFVIRIFICCAISTR